MLIKQDYVPGTTFMRLSKTGASTRMEALRAMYIVIAETFQSVTQRKFDEFATAIDGLTFRLVTSVVPDNELDMISKLYTPDCLAGIQGNDLSPDEEMKRMQRKLEFLQEERRLQSQVMSDAAWNQSETMESFVAFLKALNPAREDYWPIVYCRIGLACPLAEVPDEPVAQPQPKKPWWQRLFG
jgi:hypothetical protein